MLTKNAAKYIKSLQLKKYRKQEQKFIVEGAKSIYELLNSNLKVDTIVSTSDFFDKNRTQLQARCNQVWLASERDLVDLGSLQSNDSALAVVHTPENQSIYFTNGEYVLALDDIKDPGNLGTIIRIADWYGIKSIVCSEETAEWYNPKVIMASMGSFTRVKGYYTSLPAFLTASKAVVYGAFLDGESVHEQSFGTEGGIIVMGNEANGISESVSTLINKRISIPQFGQAESLNVAIATAVICDNLRRSQH